MRDEKYLELLAEKYPTEQAVCREIINLKAILSLPKGTEHFMSDLHGEYEAFCHILNNCSGVIREKVDLLFEDTLSDLDREEICTLIYYPVEKLAMIKKEGKNNEEWYRVILGELIDIARLFSSKYTRSKVRKAMPKEYAYILDELIHVQKDEDDNQLIYHRNILDTLLELQNADEFIEVLAGLIKRLAVDHLHIVGDIFDRGPCADRIMDLLTTYHSIDIEWGNHDILWMGAAAGSRACIATVIRNNLKYDNMKIMENSYGISLRNLTLFAEKIYPQIDPMEAALKAISVLLFKLEGQVILRNPDYKMEDKLLLHKVDVKRQVVEIGGKEYKIKKEEFPTVSFAAESVEEVYQLTEEEENVMEGLQMAFVNSIRLRQHIDFLYKKGSMYRIFNEIFCITAVCRWMRAETLTALYLGRDAIEEENIWTMQSMLPEEPGRRRRKKKTETLCGICGAEESLHFPEEIRKPLSVLMCWMSRHGMKNQIHIINSTKKKRSAI